MLTNLILVNVIPSGFKENFILSSTQCRLIRIGIKINNESLSTKKLKKNNHYTIRNEYMQKKTLIPLTIILVLIFFSIDCFAGGREIIAQKLAKFLGKYLDDLFRYLGLMGLLVFMKTISWSKMLTGSFLAIIGVFYPNKKQIDEKEGEAKIEVPKFNIFIKGSLKFTLVIAGIILIVASVFNGMDGYSAYKTSKSKGYIGIAYTVDKNNSIIITKVVENSPAAQANLRIDDKIVSINNLTINESNISNIAELLNGTIGSTVTIELKRKDSNFTRVIQRKGTEILMKY
jgi:hypothetical protein